MKKITSILLVVLLVLTCLTMAACDPKNPIDPTVPFDTAGAQAALDLYIFEDDGLVISGEFVLPGTIGGFDATWTSSSDVVTLTEIPASEENGTPKQYAVKVGYPEAVTDVTLTVSLSADVTKTFTVIVNPISVHDFISAYTFDNDKNTVVADFDLDRTCEYAGKTATIDWSVDAEYADYLEISEDGNTCIVYPTSLNPTVKINATFTYNGDSATKSYRMTVSEVKDHLQAVDYWYANTGVGMEMRGYVVEIATVYAPNYANISLYIVDEDFCAGYYLYRVKCDQATADRLVPGAPVVVTGTINTNYNGLIETNAGGTIVIDDEREALTELPVHALDEEVVGKLFSANYHQSTLVSLTNWKVKEVKDAPKAGETATLFILEKGGVEVAVAVSKYMEGAYKTAADDTVWSALAAHGIQVGDIVSVTGVLGNYKGHQIMPLSIDGIVKGDTESTYTAGVTAASAVAAIDKALADNGLNSVVAVEKNVALPTVDGATVTAKVLGASRAVTVVDGAIVVAPGKLENACVQIDITVGEFTNSIFRYIMSADLDDAEKLAMELPVLDIDFELAAEDTVLNLPATGSMFPAINVTWAFKADTTHDCATLDGNVLTITLPEVATSITIVATLSLGEAEVVTKEFTIAVDAASLDQYVAKPVEEPAVDTAYKFAVVQNLAGGTFYFTGEMSGNYLATTDKANKAVDVKLEAATDGYYLYFMDGDTKTYIEIYEYQENKGGVRLVTSAPASVFVINADYNMPTTTIGANTYYLGSYKTYTTMSVSNITYMSAEKDGVSQFGARLSTLAPAKEAAEPVEEPAVDTAYKFAVVQNLAGGTFYFTGEMSGNYLATSDKANKAVDVKLEAATDGYYLYFMDGDTKTYIEIYEYQENKGGVRLVTSAPASVFVINADYNMPTTTIGANTYYLGSYKTYTTMSVSNITYMSAEKDGVSQFGARLSNVVVKEVAAVPVEEPAVDTTYKFAVVQNLAGGTFYFTGKMSGNYLATTDSISKAVDVKLEAATDGYYLYFMDGDTKTYIEIYEYQENKGGVRLVTSAPASVFVINADYNMPTTTIGANTYYLGSYKTYTTMSVSNITYMSAEKDGVSQFGARLSTIEFVKESVEDETPDDGGETPEPTPVEKITTIAGALAVESGEAELSGTVAKITYAWNGTTCSFDLTDGTNTINVYKSTTNVTVGDVVTVVGNISVYNNKHQISEGSTVTVTTAHVCADWSDADCENPALCTVCGAAKADSQALGHTEANNEGKCDRCGVALKVAAGTYTYDIVNSFGTYANDWSSSYVAHETASTDFTGTLPKATITFSRANKQAQTITDRPVLAPKGSTEYVTVVIEGNTISSVTFALTQWGTKTFSDIHIEYFDGTAWVSCSDTITTPANITSTTLPANVTQVRLSVTATGSSNIQVGIGDITVVVA